MIRIRLSRVLGDQRRSQAWLSRETGIRPSTISEIYNEMSDRISLEHLDRICEVLDCDLSDIVEHIPNRQRKTGQDLIVEVRGSHTHQSDTGRGR